MWIFLFETGFTEETTLHQQPLYEEGPSKEEVKFGSDT